MNKKSGQYLGFNFSIEDWANLKAYSIKTGSSPSEVVKTAVKEYLR